jgi:uncharacterized membrane protein HdeD (DUF308 family)
VSEGTRRIAASALAALAALALLAAAVTGYANDALFDSNQFADRATAALDDEAVQAEVATRVTDDVVLRAQADLIGFRPLIETVVDGVVGSSVFQSAFRAGVADLHRTVFEHDQDTVTLTVADLGQVLRGAFEALRPQIAQQIPGAADFQVTEISTPGWVADVARVADNAFWAELVLLGLALGLVAGALAVDADRRRTMAALGLAVMIWGVVAVVGLGAARAYVLTRVDPGGSRDALDGIWGAFLGDLTTTLYLFAGCGAVIAAAASSLLRPVDITAPLRTGLGFIARVPERRGLRVLRAVALIAAGVLIILRRDAFLDLVVIFTGLYVVYAGVAELMRMTIPAHAAEAEADRAAGGRALIAAGIAAGLIVLAGSVFIGVGGTDESPAAIKTEGCNGSEALCDRPLDQVAFPSTHNAMSAATNPGWLFAQQEAGFPDQLHDGIRGLFIDAHYGTPTQDGTIKTDLSNLDGPERQAYEEELGTDALNAALRIRDRIVNSEVTGPREVYLCHRFCELGAIPIVDAFRQYRDFLAANPDEVLMIVIEDYVSPADIDAAVRDSGLIDYVYKGPLDPLPTLQEIIDSGGRTVMMAEKNDGGAAIPYYHSAYDALVQETPYSFKKPAQLTDPAKLEASCVPNRGQADAPMFLINHWIDTSPAPKPSNASRVNTHDALLARIRHCEQQRGLTANLISVDFYREGDLFGVVDELNR